MDDKLSTFQSILDSFKDSIDNHLVPALKSCQLPMDPGPLDKVSATELNFQIQMISLKLAHARRRAMAAERMATYINTETSTQYNDLLNKLSDKPLNPSDLDEFDRVISESDLSDDEVSDATAISQAIRTFRSIVYNVNECMFRLNKIIDECIDFNLLIYKHNAHIRRDKFLGTKKRSPKLLSIEKINYMDL